MSRSTSLTKVQAIRRSVRCFVLGLAGLLPVVGLPFAVVAIFDFKRVRSGGGAAWNPASGYLKAGLALGVLGLLSTAVLAILITIALAQSSGD